MGAREMGSEGDEGEREEQTNDKNERQKCKKRIDGYDWGWRSGIKWEPKGKLLKRGSTIWEGVWGMSTEDNRLKPSVIAATTTTT